MTHMAPIPITEIEAASKRLRGRIVRTPLVRLNAAGAPAEIFLKLENLQPIGSFKLRGAGNLMLSVGPQKLEKGVWTASAGNMAQGVAYFAGQLGIPCTVVVPETAPAVKLIAIERLGASYVKVSFSDWLEIFLTGSYEGMEGLFVHAFRDPAVMAGNGTIGTEIVEELPDLDAVIIPFGGGGLSCGIASAIRALKPDVKVFACEVETAAPLAGAFATGGPVEVDYTPTFVDGIGSPFVFADMWPLVRRLVDDSLVVGLEAIAEAIRVLVTGNRVIAEGAGATPVAAALAGLSGNGKVVCVVSGGNLDSTKLVKILQGEVP